MNRLLTVSMLLITSASCFAQTNTNANTSKSKNTAKPPATQHNGVKTDTAYIPRVSSSTPVSDPVQPTGSELRSFFETPDTSVENRLVALTLAGPEYDAASHQNKITAYELTKTKNTWLNLLTLSTTYNDQTFAHTANTTLVYPKYFFGIAIPLGIIFSTGTQIKQAREAVALGHDQQEQLARKLKADVLGKYRQYRMYTTLLKMQNEELNDVLANSAQAEQRFKDGTIEVADYISAQKIRNDEVSKNLNIKLQQDMMRLDIERMIGISLDQVLHGETPASTVTPGSKPAH